MVTFIAYAYAHVLQTNLIPHHYTSLQLNFEGYVHIEMCLYIQSFLFAPVLTGSIDEPNSIVTGSYIYE